MSNLRRKRSFGSAWKKVKRMLGGNTSRRSKKTFKTAKRPKRKKKKTDKERPMWITILVWILMFPVLLPPALVWWLLLWNEDNVKQSVMGNYEHQEIMMGNAIGSACLLFLFLGIWCFLLPLGTLIALMHILFDWSVESSFWVSIIPSAILACVFFVVCLEVLIDDQDGTK